MKWNEVSEVFFDRKLPLELKDTVFKNSIRPEQTITVKKHDLQVTINGNMKVS